MKLTKIQKRDRLICEMIEVFARIGNSQWFRIDARIWFNKFVKTAKRIGVKGFKHL